MPSAAASRLCSPMAMGATMPSPDDKRSGRIGHPTARRTPHDTIAEGVTSLSEQRNTGRAPPHDVYAEEAVLGAMLLDPAAVNAVTLKVREDDFYRHTHRTIFRTILKLRADGLTADPITVAHALAKARELADVGGAPFLHTLTEAVPTVSEAITYALIVADLGHLRRTIDVGHRIVALGYEEL